MLVSNIVGIDTGSAQYVHMMGNSFGKLASRCRRGRSFNGCKVEIGDFG